MSNLVCVLCGMKVNQKNYGFNGDTFLEKNEKDHIINCPFCGVGKMYLEEDAKMISVDNLGINDEITLALKKAMSLELFNSEYYQAASKLAKEEKQKKLFIELSRVEYEHAKIHKYLGGFSEFPVLAKPTYERLLDDEMLLEEAAKREKHAQSFYRSALDIIENEELKNIFVALIDVENQHEIIVERD